MNRSSKSHLLLPLLALCVAFAVAPAIPAHGATSASLQISFGSAPHWTNAGVTGVRRIHDGEGPGYDMFTYGGNYYAYNNDQWYRSHTARGRYAPIDRRSVPSAFSSVPRNHWRHYPTSWSAQGNNARPGAPGQTDTPNNGRGHK